MIIICEGNDDKIFLKALISHLKKENKIANIENIDTYIEKMGGKSKLLDKNSYAKLTMQIENGKKTKALFIFDADFKEDDKKCGGLENSTKCIKNLIKELNWNIKIDYYIFDKNLDYFLMNTIENNKCSNKFNELINCLEIEKIKPNKKPIANLYKALYPNKPYDFSHKNFDKIKQKLINLFKKD